MDLGLGELGSGWVIELGSCGPREFVELGIGDLETC